jgi:DNA-binding XRE family transcriptional regulator
VIKISIDNPPIEMRERPMISKCKLAKTAGLSLNTVDRVEKGKSCRLDTKTKMVEAPGFNPSLNRESASSPKQWDDPQKAKSRAHPLRLIKIWIPLGLKARHF